MATEMSILTAWQINSTLAALIGQQNIGTYGEYHDRLMPKG